MSTTPKAILNVHSSSRNYGDTSQFTINLGSNCPKPKSMSLLSAEIPNTIYNVHTHTNTLQLELKNTSGREVIKYSTSQAVLQFNIYSATGTYAPATLDNILTFSQWQSFVNTASRDFLYAYNTTTGQQLTKKTPIAQVSITFNNPAINGYMDVNTLCTTFTTLITTQLSGDPDITMDNLLAFRFQFNTTLRQFEIYFNNPKIYLETVDNTTSSFNPALGILGGGFGGVYLPTQAISQAFKYSISLPETNYTGITLAAAVQTALNTAAASDTAFLSSTPFTCTYDSTTHKITLQSNKASGGSSILATDLRININYALSPLDDILGFKSTQAAANPYIGSGLVNLANNSVIYLWCDKASALNISSTGENQYILAKIQNFEFGSYSYYNSYDPDLTRFNIGDGTGQDFSQISFSLRNEKGQVLPNNGAEWSASILLYF
jgi:hypothetical protein